MAFNLRKVQANFFKLKQELPKQLQNEALRYFVRNFDAQRWDGVPWQPRVDRSNARKLLVRRGQLRRALAGSKREATFSRIRFSVFVQSKDGYNYSEIHNEGGTIQKKARTATLGFRERRGTNGQMVFAKVGAIRKAATLLQDVHIGAHTITIPRRRFLGESRELDKILRMTIDKGVSNCFK